MLVRGVGVPLPTKIALPGWPMKVLSDTSHVTSASFWLEHRTPSLLFMERVGVRRTAYIEGEIGLGERGALQARREIVLKRATGYDNRGDSIAARFNQES